MEAYRLNMDDESLIMHIVCCRLYMTDEKYDRMIIRCGYSERVVSAAGDILKTRDDYAGSANKYARQLAELKGLKESGQVSRYYETLDATLDIWKREYRMSLT